MLPAVWQDVVVLRCTNPLGPWGFGGRKLDAGDSSPAGSFSAGLFPADSLSEDSSASDSAPVCSSVNFPAAPPLPCGCRTFCPGTAARCERGGKKRSGQEPSSDPLLFAQSAVMDFFKIFAFLSRKPHPFSACIFSLFLSVPPVPLFADGFNHFLFHQKSNKFSLYGCFLIQAYLRFHLPCTIVRASSISKYAQDFFLF